MNSLEHLQIYLDELSENKIFIGLIMVLVNIGARFIIEEFSEEHKQFIQNTYFRKLVIFCSVFMATRDIGVALIVTLIFAVVINEILGNKEEEEEDTEKDDKIEFKNKLDEQIQLLNSIKNKI
jgi:putative Mn2+ efflux pump MntP